jgi:imidazoleglycerol phosphate dehydratase HisB
MSAPRTARVERRTAEVAVTVQLDLDGTGGGGSDTGVPFLDHMLAPLGRHARFDLRVTIGTPAEDDAFLTALTEELRP